MGFTIYLMIIYLFLWTCFKVTIKHNIYFFNIKVKMSNIVHILPPSNLKIKYMQKFTFIILRLNIKFNNYIFLKQIRILENPL